MAHVIPKFKKPLFQLVQKCSEKSAARWGVKMWFTPRRMKAGAAQQAVLDAATSRRIPFQSHDSDLATGAYYMLYSWGSGPVVLLVHGWNGSAAQMIGLVQPLIEAGFQVLAFDALGHGDSPGSQSDLQAFMHIIQSLAQKTPLHALIAYSMSSIACAKAIADGLDVPRFVVIGAAASKDFYLKHFSAQLGISRFTLGRIAMAIRNRFQTNVNNLSLINIVPTLGVPGLLVHDQDDPVISHNESIALSKCWPNSRLILTQGLGRDGVLRDEATIGQVISYLREQHANQPAVTAR